MKRIIIIQIMLLSIYCTYKSCIDEKDLSQCSKHTLEPEIFGNDFSCFKFVRFLNITGCDVFLTNSDSQKAFVKYLSGIQKESKSIYPISKLEKDETLILTYDKETYDKDDTIIFKNVPLTEEEKRIINNSNTCYYHSISRFRTPQYYKGEKKINITDKNVCFNVDKFEELKGIMDCGYATIKGTFNNISFAFTDCFVIQDKNLDKTFKKYYFNMTEDENGFLFNIYSILKNNITDLDINKEARSKLEKRQLQSLDFHEIQDLDMVVEDRYGNIVRYDKNGIVVDDDDDEYDEPNKFVNANASGKISFNFILLLCLILSLN